MVRLGLFRLGFSFFGGCFMLYLELVQDVSKAYYIGCFEGYLYSLFEVG